MTLVNRMISGTAQLTVSNGMVRLLSIVTMPVLTSLLSPEAYGVATLAGTAIAVASTLALAGVDMSYARAYHSAKPPSGAAVEHFSWRFAIGGALIAAVVCSASWWLFSTVVEGQSLHSWLPMIVGAGIVLSVAHTMAQTRAQLGGRYRSMSVAVCVAGLASIACSIGVALWWRQDATGLLLAMLLSYLVPVLLLRTPSIVGMVRRSTLSANERRALLEIGFAGVLTAPIYWLLSSSDRWFLHHFDSVEAVGIYSIGYSVAIVGMMVNNAVIAVWVPEAAREYERDPIEARKTLGHLMTRLIVVMALVWLAVAAAGGDVVRLLANERFHAATDYVPYIAGGVFFYGVLHLGNGGLLLVKRLSLAIPWWTFGGIACVLLNFVLVPKLGGQGAAITQAVSFALIGMGIFATAWFQARFKLDGYRLLALLVGIAALGMMMTPPWHNGALMSLSMKLPVGAVITLVAGWVMAPAWCRAQILNLRRMAFP